VEKLSPIQHLLGSKEHSIQNMLVTSVMEQEETHTSSKIMEL